MTNVKSKISDGCRTHAGTNATTAMTTMLHPGGSQGNSHGGETNSGDDSREAETMMEDEEYTDSSSDGGCDLIIAEPPIPMGEDEVMQIR